jgi:hypothetical protein
MNASTRNGIMAALYMIAGLQAYEVGFKWAAVFLLTHAGLDYLFMWAATLNEVMQARRAKQGKRPC